VSRGINGMFTVALYGVGEINKLVARELVRRGIEIVAAIDIDPNKVGKDLGQLIGLGKDLGVTVVDYDDVLLDTQPDIVIHATGSFLDKVFDQIINSVRAGCNVISTCETLTYPWYRYPVLARLIDEEAVKYGVTVLSTGINPGFLLDTLPSVLTLPVFEVKRIVAIRVSNAGKRRPSFRKKIGLGLPIEEVKEGLKKGELTGHVGCAESVLLIADKLGIQPSKVIEFQEPIEAKENIEVGGIKVGEGCNLGIRSVGIAYVGNEEFIRVEFIAKLTKDEYEEIVIEGNPTLKWRSEGTPGDEGTAAILVNLLPEVLDAPAGLITMNDLNYLANTEVMVRIGKH